MYLSFVTTSILLLAASSQARPAASDNEAIPSGKFIHIPLIRDINLSLDRRQVSTSLSNQVRTYMIDIQIGSSAQKLTLSLDTGSAETFVNSDLCTTCTGGTYDESKSSSGQARHDLGNFETAYVDGVNVSGKYVNDDIKIGSNALHETIFAVSDNATSSGYGIMGIGLPPPQPKYPSILDNMKAQGLIESRSYSLQLNSANSTSGSIVFGGYDATNYAMISTLPLVSSGGETPRMAIEWSGIAIKAPEGGATYSKIDESRPVALDTGFTLSTLPDEVFDALAKSFDVKKSGSNYYVPCQQPQGHTELLFGGSIAPITISVPFSELAIPANLQPGGDQGQDLCMFGFQPVSAWGVSSGMMSFGDTVLRSAYLMINLDTNLVGLSQVVDGAGANCEGCIVEI